MFKNVAECESSLIACNDVIQNLEQESRMKSSSENSGLPNSSNILVFTSKVLRQASGKRIEREG